MAFPEAMWGFPHRNSFALLPAARRGLWWLISVDQPATTFVLADPFIVDPAFVVDLGDTERLTLGIETPQDAFTLVMLTLPQSSGESVTANFRAPLVFNLRRQKGLQVMSRDESFPLKGPMDLARYEPQQGVSLDNHPA